MKTIAIGETARGLIVETIQREVNDPWKYRTYAQGVEGFHVGANSLNDAMQDFARYMVEFA